MLITKVRCSLAISCGDVVLRAIAPSPQSPSKRDSFLYNVLLTQAIKLVHRILEHETFTTNNVLLPIKSKSGFKPPKKLKKLDLPYQ